MSQDFDLFGDPIFPIGPRGGRPKHVATQQNRNKVMMLLALGWNNERIASAVGISVPTLRRGYFHELKRREEQRARLEAAMFMTTWQQAQTGNVGAMKQLCQMIERNDLMLYGQAAPPAPKEPKLGKKEAALVAARSPDMGTTLGELMAQRQDPPPEGPLN